MKTRRSWWFLAPLFLLAVSSIAQVRSQVIQSSELETFLQKSKVTKATELPVGVTLPLKMTMEWNGVSHFAAFKTIDAYSTVKDFGNGNREVNFQDSYLTEIAAYEVDKIIGLGMVPSTVERSYDGKKGSAQLWVNVIMDEGARRENKVEPPNPSSWNDQWEKTQLFDNLLYNMDRNGGNLLINKDWEIILIDHSRSFRMKDELKNPKSMTRFSRSLLEGLGKLNDKILKEKTSKTLSNDQRKSLLKRRDLILDLAKRAVAERGEAAVLYP